MSPTILGVTSEPGRPTATVVVPAYNEADVVARSLYRIAHQLVTDLADYSWEVIVVDDGSTDGTGDAAAAAAPTLGSAVAVRVLRHAVNSGLGAALQTGFAASRGAVVVTVDCDLSYSPDHITRLVRALESERAHLVLASPYMAGGHTVNVPPGLERRSRAANRLLSAASYGTIATMTGMVRAYDGPFLRSLSLKALDVDINVELIYKTQILRGRIVEVPAVLDWTGLATERTGRSGMLTKRARWNTYHVLVNSFLLQPYSVFLAGGMILVGLGIVLGLLGILIGPAGALLSVAAIAAAATGTVLGFQFLLSLQVKRYFEELFHLASRRPERRNDELTEQAAPEASLPRLLQDRTVGA
jgi:glycosyltransferase involved in cell wall biosynthesis